MDKRIGQNFPQGLVHGRVVIARHIVRRDLERNLHASRDGLADPEEKVEYVAAPSRVAGANAIRPTDARREMRRKTRGRFVSLSQPFRRMEFVLFTGWIPSVSPDESPNGNIRPSRGETRR